MSNIIQDLANILTARYGKDVRQSIHDAIHDCYEDGRAGAIDLVAREELDEHTSDSDIHVTATEKSTWNSHTEDNNIHVTTDDKDTWNAKQDAIDVTASRALVSNADGEVAASAVTETELGYLDGVTSPIQTQLNNRMVKTGDSKDNTTTYTSGDEESPSAWTNVAVLETGEKHSSLFNKISTMIKNVRWLYSKLGTTDLSGIGNGTVTGAISALNSNLMQSVVIQTPGSTYSLSTSGIAIAFDNNRMFLSVPYPFSVENMNYSVSQVSAGLDGFTTCTIANIAKYKNQCTFTISVQGTTWRTCTFASIAFVITFA